MTIAIVGLGLGCLMGAVFLIGAWGSRLRRCWSVSSVSCIGFERTLSGTGWRMST